MQLAAREEEQVIGQARKLLFAPAESATVRSANRRDCEKLMDESFRSYPHYANLGVVGTNGMILASARPMVEPASQTNKPSVFSTLARIASLRDWQFPG